MGCCVSACGPTCAVCCGCPNVEEVDAVDGDGVSQLHAACSELDHALIKELLEKGHAKWLKVPQQYQKFYPLHVYAGAIGIELEDYGDGAIDRMLPKIRDTIELCVEHGADINAREERGVTALHVFLFRVASICDQKNLLEVLRIFLENGTDPTICATSGSVKGLNPVTNLQRWLKGDAGRRAEPGRQRWVEAAIELMEAYADVQSTFSVNNNSNNNSPDDDGCDGIVEITNKKKVSSPNSSAAGAAAAAGTTTTTMKLDYLNPDAKAEFVAYVVKNAVRLCERQDNIITAEQAKAMRAQLEGELANGIDYSSALRESADEQLIEFIHKKIKLLHDDGALEKNEVQQGVRRFAARFDKELCAALEKTRAAAQSGGGGGGGKSQKVGGSKKFKNDHDPIADFAADVGKDIVKDVAQDVASQALSWLF